MSRIAVLGWGSLLWDLDDLAPKVDGPWLARAGPALPMEFSRISPKRLMGLVVCLDPEHGTTCPTHAIASCRSEIAATRADLAARERAPLSMIGVATAEGVSLARLPDVGTAVSRWCAAHGWQGAVWTDLDPNFSTHTGVGFSLAAAAAYLAALEGASRAEAFRYISQAPVETDTPLRRHLAAQDWWRSGEDQQA